MKKYTEIKIKRVKTSIKPMLNGRKDNDNEYHTLIIQLIRERKRRVIFTPYKLLPAEFDAAKGMAIYVSRSREHREFIDHVNDYLHSQVEELRSIVIQMERIDKPFSAADITAAYRQRNDNRFVHIFLKSLIDELNQRGAYGTADTFRATLTTFERFSAGRQFQFCQLDEMLVSRFEKFLMQDNLSANTVIFYLSKLRTVYNKAVRQGFAAKGVNPFCNISFHPERTRKLAVNDSVLRKVATAKFANQDELMMARDLFMFSFYTRGMSFVDMAYLRQSDILGDVIRYRRRKTGQLFAVRIVPAVRVIIDRYHEMCSPWVLPILLCSKPDRGLIPLEYHGDTAEERQEFDQLLHKRYRYSRSHFLRHLRRLAKRLGLERNLTFNMARHTWASRARRQDISVAVISEGLGHTSEKTTRIYLEELEARRIDEANDIVTSF